MSELCEVCGKAADEEALRGGCVWCHSRRGYVCAVCSEECAAHSKMMLPNGTHCMEAWKREPEEEKITVRPFPASPEAVEKERQRFELFTTAQLYEKLRAAAEWYDAHRDDDTMKTQLPLARARLTAMQLILKERKAG